MTNQQTLVDYLEGYADEARRLTSSSGSMTLAQIQTALESVSPGGGGCGFDVTGLSGLKFYQCKDTSIDLSTLDTSGFTDMSAMFYQCTNLTSLDLSRFDTSNVTTMSYMFRQTGLTSLDLSRFNTGNVEDMSWMFAGSTALTSLDLGSLDMTSVTSMGSMFNGATNLASINLANVSSNITSLASTKSSYIFLNASSLSHIIWGINSTTKINVPHTDFFKRVASGTTYMCRVYVRDSLYSSYNYDDTFWGACNAAGNQVTRLSELPANLQALYDIDPNDYP